MANKKDDNLQKSIDEKRLELAVLETQRENLHSRKDLEETLGQVIWEQFIIQISGGASEEFIREFLLSLYENEDFLFAFLKLRVLIVSHL